MNGRYSKLMPKNLAELYEEARNDPELLEMKTEAAVLDARLCQLISKVNENDNGKVWKELNLALNDLEAARATGDKQGVANALNGMAAIIHQGASNHSTWSEIERLVLAKRKLAETVLKKEMQQERYLTIDKVLVLSAMVVQVFRQSVLNYLPESDERAINILAQTSEEIQKLMPINDSQS